MNQPNTYGPTIKGMLHKLKMIQAISNNIAQANSIAYQRQIPEAISFESVLNDVAARDTSAGQLTKTNNQFDLAIEGNAYFLVESVDGPVPTKNGRFHLNEKGELITMEGQSVIVVEKIDEDIALAKEKNIRINSGGEIFVGHRRYGRIALHLLDNKPVRIHQGFIEGSNVNLMNEIVSLAMAFRAFDASEKTLGMEASIDKELIEKYGRNV